MNDPWNVAQYCEENVDQEVGIAATFEKDAKRWQDNGEDDFANVAVIDKPLACVTAFRKAGGSCLMLCLMCFDDHVYGIGRFVTSRNESEAEESQ